MSNWVATNTQAEKMLYIRMGCCEKLVGIPVEIECKIGKQNGYGTSEAIHLAFKHKLRLPHTLPLIASVD